MLLRIAGEVLYRLFVEAQWLVNTIQEIIFHPLSASYVDTTESVPTKVDESGITSLSQPADGWLNKIAAAGGTFVGSLGKAYFS
jgi:hypothetical protein